MVTRKAKGNASGKAAKPAKREREWEHNPSTGNSILRLTKNTRIVRMGPSPGQIYQAEYWGDYSLKYPVKGPWRTTLMAAEKDIVKLRKK